MDSLQVLLVLYPGQQHCRVSLGPGQCNGREQLCDDLRLIDHVEELRHDGHAATCSPQAGEEVVIASVRDPSVHGRLVLSF